MSYKHANELLDALDDDEFRKCLCNIINQHSSFVAAVNATPDHIIRLFQALDIPGAVSMDFLEWVSDVVPIFKEKGADVIKIGQCVAAPEFKQ